MVCEGQAARPGREPYVLQHRRGGVAVDFNHRLALLQTQLRRCGGGVIAADAPNRPAKEENDLYEASQNAQKRV